MASWQPTVRRERCIRQLSLFYQPPPPPRPTNGQNQYSGWLIEAGGWLDVCRTRNHQLWYRHCIAAIGGYGIERPISRSVHKKHRLNCGDCHKLYSSGNITLELVLGRRAMPTRQSWTGLTSWVVGSRQLQLQSTGTGIGYSQRQTHSRTGWLVGRVLMLRSNRLRIFVEWHSFSRSAAKCNWGCVHALTINTSRLWIVMEQFKIIAIKSKSFRCSWKWFGQ